MAILESLHAGLPQHVRLNLLCFLYLIRSLHDLLQAQVSTLRHRQLRIEYCEVLRAHTRFLGLLLVCSR
jgi:hypothetical protein